MSINTNHDRGTISFTLMVGPLEVAKSGIYTMQTMYILIMYFKKRFVNNQAYNFTNTDDTSNITIIFLLKYNISLLTIIIKNCLHHLLLWLGCNDNLWYINWMNLVSILLILLIKSFKCNNIDNLIDYNRHVILNQCGCRFD